MLCSDKAVPSMNDCLHGALQLRPQPGLGMPAVVHLRSLAADTRAAAIGRAGMVHSFYCLVSLLLLLLLLLPPLLLQPSKADVLR
jgi:hypothetical protein